MWVQEVEKESKKDPFQAMLRKMKYNSNSTAPRGGGQVQRNVKLQSRCSRWRKKNGMEIPLSD
jgi:hypothetical protein